MEGGCEVKEITVRDLRYALIGVPDDIPVWLDSDSGVDQASVKLS